MTETKPPAKKAGKVALGCLGFAVVFFLLVVLVSTCATEGTEDAPGAGAPAEPAAAPRSIRSADKSIRVVQVTPPVFYVGAKLGTAWDDAQYVDFAGLVVKSIGKGLQAGVEEDKPGVTDVKVSFEVPGTDRLGNDITIPLATMVFSYSDLKAANFDNLGIGGTLNLAKDVDTSGLAGQQALAQWCVKEDNARSARLFCMQALD